MTLTDLLPPGAAGRSAFWQSSLRRTTLLEGFAKLVPEPLAVYPAAGSMRHQLHGNNWLAIGDAAAAYDPLHGWGIVAALMKGIAAARLLTASEAADASRRYAETERSTFAAYEHTRRALYREGAVSRDGQFWREALARSTAR